MRSLLTTLILLMTAACATRAEVEEIVLSSNAAMLGPTLSRPGGAPGEGWAEAVDRIDRLIALHPDNTVLVNHLRVRQAMLLTVNERPALATEVWKLVDPAELSGNARDRALYGVRAELVWAYRVLPYSTLLNVEERKFAAKATQRLRGQDGPAETREYFRIVAAQIVIKRANSMPQATEEDRDGVGETLAMEAKRFIAKAPDAAARWADGTAKEKKETLAGSEAISAMRSRVWFSRVVTLFEEQARAVERPLELEWSIVVRVLHDGAPVPDTRVTIHSPRHAAHATKTDAAGEATIASRFPGRIRIRAVKGPDEYEKTVEIGHGVTVTVELEN